jgi:hypothetical protein
MKHILLGLFLVGCLAVPTAGASSDDKPEASKSFQFAGIPWGSDTGTVKEKMMAAGFTFKKQDEDGDLVFEGSVLGYDARAYCLMAQGRAVKVMITIYTPDNKARETYNEMKGLLAKKYGEGQYFKSFDPPYDEGDGYEDQAIGLGKAHFDSFWGEHKGEAGTYPEGLFLTITEELTVRVSYESSDWGAEADRRKAKETKAF